MIQTLVVGLLLAVIAFLIWYPRYLRRHPDRRHRTTSAHAGLVRGMDEVWHPEAIAPTASRDEETRLVRPAPAPDPDLGIAGGVARIRVRD